MLYNTVAIAGLKCLSQLNYTAYFGDLKQKSSDLKLVIWLVTSPKKWWLEWTARLSVANIMWKVCAVMKQLNCPFSLFLHAFTLRIRIIFSSGVILPIIIIIFFQQDGETALHLACRGYYPSYRETIDICVVLIEAGADHQQKSKVSGQNNEG